MKDKEKQIESKVLTLGNELYCKQDKFDMSNPYEVAEAVIDLGYRKIDKDSVVLSREEYVPDFLPRMIVIPENLAFDIAHRLDNVESEIKQAEKEIAKEILDEVSKHFGGAWLVDLYKKYGVEIKE